MVAKDSSVQSGDAVEAAGFAEVWAEAEEIPGWLTRAQGLSLYEAALRQPAGAHIVEIGSHQGRSTVVLGAAARQVGARVTAIDPFVEGRLFGGTPTRDRFEANIARHRLADVVTLRPEYSTRLRPVWTEGIDLLYIDGKHDYWTFSDDLRWSRSMQPGGEILVHDCFSSIGVTLGVTVRILPTGRYIYLDRAGSLARFRLGAPTLRDRARILREVPWFARNFVLKVLLRLRLRPVAAALGHAGPYDPF
ncbi:putative O-methyltransferase YrrM [Allocatelliglobosispora scoriae]|uniref:Putative O-methyltransferase YrrM n=1 Tax=Allocatelliglobosispora scoriae TaxID=643052 RepID=A0A841BL57_9ACTN|nr:class I SAM-dependent methyltransferase [Allocatelliglobosispora scoriae]MBB5869827.1 putative O-methyltransferase YrrM [Allocatelliglobosispora scoriae]